MRKITFVLVLLTFGTQAQTFPSPYCDITDAADVVVEEISSVAFGGTNILNTDMTTVLVDETTTIVSVTPDGTYTLVVSGNTYGNFDTNIVAFIDWNQNHVLDDAGEVYEIGTLTNSNGSDGISVTMDITVPTDAILGTTRIRITKTYTDEDSVAEITPCGIQFNPFGMGIYSGYGQAIDFTLQVAGLFPSPYCEITDADEVVVEEITTVTFAGTTITNIDPTSVLLDETATIVNVAPNETYTIEVEGNTYGDFDTDIVAFIDWNQNNLLDDAGEVYEIGTLTNSNGNDGLSVTMDITVPIDAIEGAIRIRITKTYQDPDSPAEINPCAIEFYPFGYGPYPGYGQALDFTLNISSLSVETFEVNALSVYPVPTKDVLHIKYKSVIHTVRVYNLLGQEVFAKIIDLSHVQLDLSSFRAGVYMVKLFTEGGQQHSIRIIKQ